ncbi:MAG TPA: phosphoribosyltransferase [Patescibacteria group bacterium]|nr:phosphoribosyltransferase [Patescibacteria group bacterium]
MPHVYFKDRSDAGKQLAQSLENLRGRDSRVLALPRGGVPVAVEIAKFLHIPMDIFVARKLGAPHNPEFGVGAIAEGGVIVFDNSTLRSLGLTQVDMQDIITEEFAEMERRIALYRGNRHNLQIGNKTVILVDDGLATGITALAAIRSLKLSKPKEIILAVPVCAQDSADNLRQEGITITCLHAPHNFMAVGLWYKNFAQTTDQEVLDILTRANKEMVIGHGVRRR